MNPFSTLTQREPLFNKIDKFVQIFPTLTREEADFIEQVLKWDDETKIAFGMAKRMFDEDVETPPVSNRRRRKNKA